MGSLEFKDSLDRGNDRHSAGYGKLFVLTNDRDDVVGDVVRSHVVAREDRRKIRLKLRAEHIGLLAIHDLRETLNRFALSASDVVREGDLVHDDVFIHPVRFRGRRGFHAIRGTGGDPEKLVHGGAVRRGRKDLHVVLFDQKRSQAASRKPVRTSVAGVGHRVLHRHVLSWRRSRHWLGRCGFLRSWSGDREGRCEQGDQNRRDDFFHDVSFSLRLEAGGARAVQFLGGTNEALNVMVHDVALHFVRGENFRVVLLKRVVQHRWVRALHDLGKPVQGLALAASDVFFQGFLIHRDIHRASRRAGVDAIRRSRSDRERLSADAVQKAGHDLHFRIVVRENDRSETTACHSVIRGARRGRDKRGRQQSERKNVFIHYSSPLVI